MRILFTAISGNKKTGPIATVISSKETCPDCCPLKKGGCYAQIGPLNLHWERLTNGSAGIQWNEFLTKLKGLRAGSLWRWGTAGDLPGKNSKIDRPKLREMTEANKNKRNITYTHKPVLSGQAPKSIVKENRAAIKEANSRGFIINLSANSLSHADALLKLGIGPVVSVVPSDQTKNHLTPAGNRVVICPASTHDNVTCSNCGICARGKREYIVGFPAHGISYKKVNEIARAA